MRVWNYSDDIPFIPVKLIGRKRTLDRVGIVDSGAGFCVVHDYIAELLDLEKVEERDMIGFGSKQKFPVDVCIISIEIYNRVENVLCAVIKEEYYPEKVPKVVLGRTLLNKFKITLDGKNKKIYLE